jgi:hypothetical protein
MGQFPVHFRAAISNFGHLLLVSLVSYAKKVDVWLKWFGGERAKFLQVSASFLANPWIILFRNGAQTWIFFSTHIGFGK